MWALLSIPVALIIFILIIIIRAIRFSPKPQPKIDTDTITFDSERAADNLSKLIQCKTISYRDASLEDDAEFQKLIDRLLPFTPT